MKTQQWSHSKSFSKMSKASTHKAIETVARNSYGRLIADLAARSGAFFINCF
jgi:hypothetical protein